MNSEEPILAAAANVQVSTTGHKLPEQAKFPVSSIPRPMSFFSLINQWQPMGIRVVVNLPFTGDDKDFLFCIRNGPFIPPHYYSYYTKAHEGPSNKKDDYPISRLACYAWNNMRNVLHGTSKFDSFPKNPPVFITQYDEPPLLASLAACFRRWRGDIQYRIRTVAGFATQGYIFIGPLKNVFSPIGIYDENRISAPIFRSDSSYREVMMNAYVLGDTSMFRHMEVTVPFEYPVSYYDQYAWMARRTNPNKYTYENQALGRMINLEPHGDNWICMGVRGNLAATHEGAQIMFELEYRAMEGFQFADPGLPFSQLKRPHRERDFYSSFLKTKIIPNFKLYSDGLGKISDKADLSTNLLSDSPAPAVKLEEAPAQQTQTSSVMSYIQQEYARQSAVEIRNGREILDWHRWYLENSDRLRKEYDRIHSNRPGGSLIGRRERDFS